MSRDIRTIDTVSDWLIAGLGTVRVLIGSLNCLYSLWLVSFSGLGLAAINLKLPYSQNHHLRNNKCSCGFTCKIKLSVLSFFLVTAENNDFSQLSRDNNSIEYGCPCTYCEKQCQQCVENTKTISPKVEPYLKSPLVGPHSQFQHSPSDQIVCSIFSREESSFEEDEVLMSFLKSHRQLCSYSNMSSIEVAKEDVAMETTGTPPLPALKSLCSSISPNIFPTISSSCDTLSRKKYSSCARNSKTFVLDSVLRNQNQSCKLIPRTTQLSFYDLSSPLAPGSHVLWRPWIA